jgi:hypothetical protein
MDPTRRFDWTEQSEKLVSLVARGEDSNNRMAEELGIAVSTLKLWKSHPEFRRAVEEHVKAYREVALSTGVAILQNRLRRMNERYDRLYDIMLARASHPDYQGFPGGDSGLLIRRVKRVKSTVLKDGKEIEIGAERVEFELDKDLLREMRELEILAAKETGQWIERHEVDHYDTRQADELGRKIADLAQRLGVDRVAGELDGGREERTHLPLGLLGQTESVPSPR